VIQNNIANTRSSCGYESVLVALYDVQPRLTELRFYAPLDTK